jgi:L-iditol 2-dehydrogenase
MHAFERAPVKLGTPTLICGAGPIGLCALACAKASGAFPLVITDVDEARLKFAKTFVPQCETFKVDPKVDPETAAKSIVELFTVKLSSEQPPIAYECTGVQSSVATAAYATRTGGQVMVIGVGKRIMDGLPFMHLSFGEIDLKFINRYHHSWPSAIRLLESGYIDLRPMVSHTFTLEEAVKAMETASDRSLGAVKVHILDAVE